MSLTEEQYARIITERLDAVKNFRASIEALGYTRQSQILEHTIAQVESDPRVIKMQQTLKDEETERNKQAYDYYVERSINGWH